jgi:hypothetical protein
MPEKPTRVGDLIKAKEVNREDVEAAIATVFDGKTSLPLRGGSYALILPDLAKMTPFAREAILSTLIEAGAVKG